MDNSTQHTDQGDQAAPKEAWQEVGQQFKVLGESLAQAFRTAWSDEDNRRRAEELRSGLEAMVSEVGRAIEDTANTPEGKQARDAVEKTADHLVIAGEKTVQEVRPHLMNALRQVNEELLNFIEKMEREKPPTEEERSSDPPAGTA